MGTFKDVVGHKDIINYIRNAVREDKVSHAYILNGERGAGKKMLANLFAATLLCEKGGPDPCNECHSCRQAESGNHPDIIKVTHEKPNSISVDDIREQVNNTIIMLLTENADTLLPTINSRCVMLKLRNIKDTLIKKYLMETMQVPDYKADMCTAFAQGNMGRAIMLANSEHFNEIRDEAVQLLKYINEMELSEIVQAVSRITAYKLEINDYLDIIMIWYRDVLLYKATKDMDKVVFKDQIKYIKERAKRSSYEGIELIIESLEKAKARLKANVNFDLVMELLFLTIKEN